MVLEQGVPSGADYQGRKDDVFPEILFTITEAWERDAGEQEGCWKGHSDEPCSQRAWRRGTQNRKALKSSNWAKK